MKKVIVYGLGKRFQKYKDKIQNNYHIVGYCDKDRNKGRKYDEYITFEDLSDCKLDYDTILVVPVSACGIVYDLIKMGIKKDKIELFDENAVTGDIHNIPLISYYARNSEDIIIDNLLLKFGIVYERLNYCEIGVNHPFVNSNTYYFYLKGARGVLVDANPEVQLLCSMFRKGDTLVSGAVCGKKKADSVSFYLTEMRGLSSIHNDLFPRENKNYTVEQIINVPCYSINEVLSYCKNDLDLLSIDLEGEDWNVITSVNFQIFHPKIIVIELQNEKLNRYMDLKGYILYALAGVNSIFITKNCLNKVKDGEVPHNEL